ncbi:unnamed protein product [Brassica oleracea var. botrytis]|uniref:Ubiquitin carboxyl-terminal hydrolase n=1 Tax=Brassica napus TaxID=3708 RepID=A0A078H4P6_BRANA|nr:unnamed protein product [Brassica napus]CDY32369.1 BnaC01g36880D [Brassica napus]
MLLDETCPPSQWSLAFELGAKRFKEYVEGGGPIDFKIFWEDFWKCFVKPPCLIEHKQVVDVKNEQEILPTIPDDQLKRVAHSLESLGKLKQALEIATDPKYRFALDQKLMGTAVKAPEEKQATNLGYSAGLLNLGNTCYMNSTVQCLKSVPELNSALSNYSLDGPSNHVDENSHLLTVATRELFRALNRGGEAVSPDKFWNALRNKFAVFGDVQNGNYMPQDAEECWTNLLNTLSQSLKPPSSSEDSDPVKALFGVNLWSRVHCPESGEEEITTTESVLFLSCFISNEGLKDKLEKRSKALGRNADFHIESLIDSLPRYLTFRFMRFIWEKETSQNAKILKKVDYPLELDIYELCSEELRKKLEAPRQKLRDEKDKRLGTSSMDSDVKMTDAEEPSKESGKSSTAAQTGIYDLVSVLTHEGITTDNGHYLAWVKQESGTWIKYDDTRLSPQQEEDIMKLSGDGTGGDPMAYIIMYKARFVSM